MQPTLVRNSVQCNNCGDILTSLYTHDYVECSCFSKSKCCGVDSSWVYSEASGLPMHVECEECGKQWPDMSGVAIDGGLEDMSVRRLGNLSNWTELNVWTFDTDADFEGEAMVTTQPAQLAPSITFKELMVRTAVGAAMYCLFLPLEYGGRLVSKVVKRFKEEEE